MKDAIRESFTEVTRSNLGTTLGMIIFGYARPPTDREKLVWILEEQTSHGIYLDCASATIPHLCITITWGDYQNHKAYPQRNYLATVSSKQYGTQQQIIYFDDMLPHGRGASILMHMHQIVPGYLWRIRDVYTEKMRELYAKYSS